MNQYELHPKTHSVYAVYFSDARIKIGVTADVAKRMTYYAQESRRNRVRSLTWWSCAPTEKDCAYRIERLFCRGMQDAAISRHREWFEGDASAFQSVIKALDGLRADIASGEEVATDLPFLGRWGHIATEVRA